MSFFAGFRKGMKSFGECISIIVNSLLLSVVYLVGVGVTSIFARLFGKHFLDKKPIKKDSYWEDLNLGKRSMDEYTRQF